MIHCIVGNVLESNASFDTKKCTRNDSIPSAGSPRRTMFLGVMQIWLRFEKQLRFDSCSVQKIVIRRAEDLSLFFYIAEFRAAAVLWRGAANDAISQCLIRLLPMNFCRSAALATRTCLCRRATEFVGALRRKGYRNSIEWCRFGHSFRALVSFGVSGHAKWKIHKDQMPTFQYCSSPAQVVTTLNDGMQ